MMIRGANGTGKTLTYLLPILNNMYMDQAIHGHSWMAEGGKWDSDGIRLEVGRDNEDIMFQNAISILQANKKRKKIDQAPFRGAVIVSKSKELINQIYTNARLLDTVDQVRFNRMTSSLQMNSPIVEHITPDQSMKDEDEEDKVAKQKKLFHISLSNVANNCTWEHCDVLLSMPITLSHILDKREQCGPYEINPRVIVFDEVEQMMEGGDETSMKHLHHILRKFFTNNPKDKNDVTKMNPKRQFIFVGSSMQSSLVERLQDMFPGIVDIKDEEHYAKVPSTVSSEEIYIDSDQDDIQMLIDLLRKEVLKDLIDKNQDSEGKRGDSPTSQNTVMIFCESKSKITRIVEEL